MRIINILCIFLLDFLCSVFCITSSIDSLSTGPTHVCIVSATNQLKCWGGSAHGALGNGATAPDVHTPPATTVDVGAPVASVCAMMYATCVLLVDGNVKCWGHNDLGQLGRGDTQTTGDVPSRLPSAYGVVYKGANATSRVIQLACGVSHVCFLLDDGRVRCHGSNVYAQLGLGEPYAYEYKVGDNEQLSTVPDVSVGGTVVEIVSGWYHVVCRLDNGRVVTWGAEGALGRGNLDRVGDDEHPSDLPALGFPNGAKALKLHANGYQWFAECDDGNIYGYGQNLYAQLGYVTTSFATTNYGDGAGETTDAQTPINFGTGISLVSFSAGYRATCAIMDDSINMTRILRCWGYGWKGALCSQDQNTWGNDPPEYVYNAPPVILESESIRTISQVKCGAEYCYILYDDDCLKSFGNGMRGIGGRGGTENFCDEPSESLPQLSCIDVGFFLASSQPTPAPTVAGATTTTSPSPNSPPSPSPPPTAAVDDEQTSNDNDNDNSDFLDKLRSFFSFYVILAFSIGCILILICILSLLCLGARRRRRLFSGSRRTSSHSSSRRASSIEMQQQLSQPPSGARYLQRRRPMSRSAQRSRTGTRETSRAFNPISPSFI